jgi:hypothetical protein
MTIPALTSLTLVNGTSVLDVNANVTVLGTVTNNGTITVGD